MAARFRLTEPNVEDLATILSLGDRALKDLAIHLQNLDSPTLRPSELVIQISKALDVEESTADTIAKNLVMYRGLMFQTALSAEEVVKAATQEYQRRRKLDVEQERALASHATALQELLMLKAVRLVTATIDLSYEYANLLRSSRIITDIRPFFDETAQIVEGAVVSHTLRIRYDSVDGDHEIQLAIDASDIDYLAEQCERAKIKAATAQSIMIDKAGVPTSISGDDSDVE